MSDQPTSLPDAATAPFFQTSAAAVPTTTAADPTAPAPTPPAPTPPAQPTLRRGQLVSYVVVDGAGNEHDATGLVVDVFDVVDQVEQADASGAIHRVEATTTHARVVHLATPLAISIDALTVLS